MPEFRKQKTISCAHISSIVSGGLCPTVKMISPDKRLDVLFNKRGRMAYPLEYKYLPNNYFAILQTLVTLLQI
jgi:hypothetical protein